MRHIIIVTNKNFNQLKWFNEIKHELINDFYIHNISSMKQLTDLIENLNDYLIISNFNTNYFIIDALKNKKINPRAIVFVGTNNNDYEEIIDLSIIYSKIKMIIFQIKDKNLNNEIKNFRFNIPFINTNHDFLDIEYYIDYLKFYLTSTYNITKFNKISESSLDLAVKKCDENRKKYKYINNWLFDPQNRLLCFKYKGENYIIKRTTKKKGLLEIENAKKLYGILNSVCISDFNLKIIIPRYIDITQEYGYIISQSYGKDLNQYYYENENNHFGEKFRKVYQEVKKILTNNYNYNGFIPRNLIVNKKDLFLIDFEDLNNKPTSVIETTQIIAWSYIINLDIKELLKNDTINTSLDLDNDLQNLLVNYPNISKLAIIAESSYNSNRKIDDIINIVSEYVEYEVELVLDILLYETSEHKLSKLFVQQLYALAEKLKLIALFMDNKEVTKKFIMIY